MGQSAGRATTSMIAHAKAAKGALFVVRGRLSIIAQAGLSRGLPRGRAEEWGASRVVAALKHTRGDRR
jgi:hypothetical protein